MPKGAALPVVPVQIGTFQFCEILEPFHFGRLQRGERGAQGGASSSVAASAAEGTRCPCLSAEWRSGGSARGPRWHKSMEAQSWIGQLDLRGDCEDEIHCATSHAEGTGDMTLGMAVMWSRSHLHLD